MQIWLANHMASWTWVKEKRDKERGLENAQEQGNSPSKPNLVTG